MPFKTSDGEILMEYLNGLYHIKYGKKLFISTIRHGQKVAS
jgi:hypothetical protein